MLINWLGEDILDLVTGHQVAAWPAQSLDSLNYDEESISRKHLFCNFCGLKRRVATPGPSSCCHLCAAGRTLPRFHPNSHQLAPNKQLR